MNKEEMKTNIAITVAVAAVVLAIIGALYGGFVSAANRDIEMAKAGLHEGTVQGDNGIHWVPK